MLPTLILTCNPYELSFQICYQHHHLYLTLSAIRTAVQYRLYINIRIPIFPCICITKLQFTWPWAKPILEYYVCSSVVLIHFLRNSLRKLHTPAICSTGWIDCT